MHKSLQECLRLQFGLLALDSAAAAPDAHSWELDFLCSAAAEALWRRLLVDDIRGAEHIVEKVRQEVCFHEGRLCGN